MSNIKQKIIKCLKNRNEGQNLEEANLFISEIEVRYIAFYLIIIIERYSKHTNLL